jgi:L-asparaginase II
VEEPWVVEVTRGAFVESVHRVDVVVLEPDGAASVRAGDVAATMLGRSALKPAQAVAVLEAGADLDDRELALAAGSHSGEPVHLELAAALLARLGLGAGDLGCPPARPLGVAADHAWGERAPETLAMNCSGKHVAMLAACLARHWPLAGYLDPEHPLQQQVRRTLERLAGPVHGVTVDGCGAPAFATDLLAVARLAQRLGGAGPPGPEHRVAAAMRAHPELVAGSDRLDTVVMASLPGALSKVGAEGVLAVALPDGASLAVKAADGAGRAVGPARGAAPARVGDPRRAPRARRPTRARRAPPGR